MYCGRGDKLPIIYKVTEKWHNAGLNGFMYNNIKFSGVYELLEDYTYYMEHPNALYRKGYDESEIEFDDELCNIIEYGKQV